MNSTTPLWKTKTFWIGVLAIAGGLIECIFDGWSAGVEKMMVGGAIITGRQAIAKIQ